jgi:hypothetical protein
MFIWEFVTLHGYEYLSGAWGVPSTAWEKQVDRSSPGYDSRSGVLQYSVAHSNLLLILALLHIGGRTSFSGVIPLLNVVLRFLGANLYFCIPFAFLEFSIVFFPVIANIRINTITCAMTGKNTMENSLGPVYWTVHVTAQRTDFPMSQDEQMLKRRPHVQQTTFT